MQTQAQTPERESAQERHADVRRKGGAGSAFVVVDHRPQTAQLTAMQASIDASPPQQKFQALQDRIGAHAAQFKVGDVAPVQRAERVVASTAQVVQRVQIHVGDESHELADLDAKPQEDYNKLSYAALDELWGQLEPSPDWSADDRDRATRVTHKVHNAYHLWKNSESASDHWAGTHAEALGEGDSLHDLVYNVIGEAMDDTNTITGMDSDAIEGYRPETQLSHCLAVCKGKSDATLATSLYTTYLYQPLNRYFRGIGDPPDESTGFGRLVVKTAEILRGHYEAQEETALEGKRYRVELKSGWIGDAVANIKFDAPTSTQIDIDGVKNMWGDVANGTFGAFDNIALLIFEGQAKKVRPAADIKYFEGETEDMLAPASQFDVADRYSVEGDLPGIGRKTIRVFLLRKGVPADTALPGRITFGDIVPAGEAADDDGDDAAIAGSD